MRRRRSPPPTRWRPASGPGGKTVTLDSLSGRSAKAIYILQISNTSSVPTDMGQLNDWSISMGQPVLNDGLGQTIQ